MPGTAQNDHSRNPSAELLPEYVAVVEHGSISKASRALGIPRATLSRRINALEEALGVRLLHRQTRPMQMTPAGEELFDRARRVVRDTQDIWDAVRVHDGEPRGLLRVSVPPNSPIYLDYILTFMAQYPEVELVVSADARHVNLIAEGIDVAIRIGEVRDSNLIARNIWRSSSLAVASKAYVQREGLPHTLDELAQHACVRTFQGNWAPSSYWPLWNGEQIEVTGGLMCNDITLALGALRAGQGIAIVPRELIGEELISGALIPVLESIVGVETRGNVVFVEKNFLLPQVRAFVDGLVAFLKV